MSNYRNAGFWGCLEDNRSNHGCGNSILDFLATISPGMMVELQYDHQRPARGIFQGFERGNVLLTNFDGFPGLVRIRANQINAISPFGYGHDRKRD